MARPGARIFRYPDLAVSCDPRDDSPDGEELDYISFPTFILETLSGSTEQDDRTTKFAEYRSIPTFREYALAEASRMAVHVYRRQDDGAWALTSHAGDDEIALESLDVRLPVAGLYRKVRFASPAN